MNYRGRSTYLYEKTKLAAISGARVQFAKGGEILYPYLIDDG